MNALQVGSAEFVGAVLAGSICVSLLNIGAKLYRIARALEKLANRE